jgi:DNA mismatch repair protein MutL
MGIIKRLDNLVAQRIAAGEVIERPASVVRELIDNSIDADATEITLYIEGGGIDRIKLVDNGKGISEEDLPLTVQRHATSKISTLDDLYHLKSLGFRGEALYSVAAVSRLTIESAIKGREGHRYVVDNAEEGILSPSGITSGTQITVEDLFFHIPARKNFLKRAQSEAKLCRQTLIQKALSSPSVHYMFFSDGALKLDLPAKNTLSERVLDVITSENNFAKGDFVTAEGKYEGFSITLVASKPSLYRSDRSGIRIFLNKRQIDEFSLVQAVSYGYGELLPGGSFPYACAFVEDDPEMVDFNIHPAKREAKIRNLASVHHALSTLVKDSIPRTFNTYASAAYEQPFLPSEEKKPFKSAYIKDSFPSPVPSPSTGNSRKEDFRSPLSVFERTAFRTEERPSSPAWLEKAKAMAKREENFVPRDSSTDIWNPLKEESFTYIGQAFNLFLIAEKDGKLYLVDQHAAHERIIYDRLKAQTDVQKLLVPIEFEVSADTDAFLMENSDIYTSFGIMISRKEEKLWLLTSIPSVCRPIEKQILEFIQTRTGDTAELESALYAIIACKAAVKAGDKCDVFTAKAILEEVFKMKNPCCPHGRTFVVILTEEELRKMVGRTN